MSAALRIDTLKFVRKLTDAGMERQVAEAIADGLADADTSDLVTKSDLAALKAELKGDIHSLRLEFADSKADMFRFMMLQAVTIIGVTVALIKLLP